MGKYRLYYRKDGKDARVVSQDLGAYYTRFGGSKCLFNLRRTVPMITKCSECNPSAEDTVIELPQEDLWPDNSLRFFRVEARV